MEGKTGHSRRDQHQVVKEKYDEVQSDGSFISTEGLETFGAGFFANYLANPQSKLLRLTRTV